MRKMNIPMIALTRRLFETNSSSSHSFSLSSEDDDKSTYDLDELQKFVDAAMQGRSYTPVMEFGWDESVYQDFPSKLSYLVLQVVNDVITELRDSKGFDWETAQVEMPKVDPVEVIDLQVKLINESPHYGKFMAIAQEIMWALVLDEDNEQGVTIPKLIRGMMIHPEVGGWNHYNIGYIDHQSLGLINHLTEESAVELVLSSNSAVVTDNDNRYY